MRKNLPAILITGLRYLFGINRDHDALIAEFFRRFFDERAPADRGCIDRHLVGTTGEQFSDVVHRPHPAANRQRHETRLGRARNHIVNGIPVFMAGGDIEKTQLVGAGGIVCNCGLHRIAGIAKVDEIDPFDHTAIFDIEARDDTNFEHYEVVLALRIN